MKVSTCLGPSLSTNYAEHDDAGRIGDPSYNPTMSLVHLTARELIEKLSSRETTAVEVTHAFLDQIAAQDGNLHAFLRVNSHQALDQAAAIDERRKRGEKVGPLAGLSIAIKDVLCTQGEVTTCGSRMLANFRPPYDATVVARLRAADAVLIGKTNMDEFAMGASCENSAFGPTRNPWDPARIPGGSSGGSAACVAASMAPLALGSDTGGSIRQPAALCGLTGLKPTYGRVSRFGLIAFASSLDQVGPMAWTAEDAALLLEVIAGHDPLDSTSVPQPVPKYGRMVREPLAGLRLGVVREHYGPGLNADVEAAVREALRVYQSLGAKLIDISLPHAKYAVATYYVIAPCEASSNLARYDGAHYGYRSADHRSPAGRISNPSDKNAPGKTTETDSPLVRMYRDSRAEGLGPEVKRRIMLGTYALSAGYYEAFYLKALKVRRLIRRDYDEAFGRVDVIAGPVTPDVAFPIGEKADDPLAMYLVDLYTVSANLTGVPSISISCGRSSHGLPIGLQLQAPPLEEERLLRAAHMYQSETDWHRRRPSTATTP